MNSPEKRNSDSGKDAQARPLSGCASKAEGRDGSKSRPGNCAGPRKLSADDVCSYVWLHMIQETRGALAANAGISDLHALLEWYEIGPAERDKLRPVLADLIEANASRQRAEWCKAKGVAA